VKDTHEEAPQVLLVSITNYVSLYLLHILCIFSMMHVTNCILCVRLWQRKPMFVSDTRPTHAFLKQRREFWRVLENVFCIFAKGTVFLKNDSAGERKRNRRKENVVHNTGRKNRRKSRESDAARDITVKKNSDGYVRHRKYKEPMKTQVKHTL